MLNNAQQCLGVLEILLRSLLKKYSGVLNNAQEFSQQCSGVFSTMLNKYPTMLKSFINKCSGVLLKRSYQHCLL